jgi:hypothetical protein
MKAGNAIPDLKTLPTLLCSDGAGFLVIAKGYIELAASKSPASSDHLTPAESNTRSQNDSLDTLLRACPRATRAI